MPPTSLYLEIIALQFLPNRSCVKRNLQVSLGHLLGSIKNYLQKCSLREPLLSLHVEFKYAQHILMIVFFNVDSTLLASLNLILHLSEITLLSQSSSNSQWNKIFANKMSRFFWNKSNEENTFTLWGDWCQPMNSLFFKAYPSSKLTFVLTFSLYKKYA